MSCKAQLSWALPYTGAHTLHCVARNTDGVQVCTHHVPYCAGGASAVHLRINAARDMLHCYVLHCTAGSQRLHRSYSQLPASVLPFLKEVCTIVLCKACTHSKGPLGSSAAETTNQEATSWYTAGSVPSLRSNTTKASRVSHTQYARTHTTQHTARTCERGKDLCSGTSVAANSSSTCNMGALCC
jgi:hypothetical protein